MTKDIIDERTYCEECFENFDEDGFDYRFERPVCLKCASDMEGEIDD